MANGYVTLLRMKGNDTDDIYSLLHASEREISLGFSGGNRSQFVASRAAVKISFGFLASEPRTMTCVKVVNQKNGAPMILGQEGRELAKISISHTDLMVAGAASLLGVGIDIEVKRRIDSRKYRFFMTKEEIADCHETNLRKNP